MKNDFGSPNPESTEIRKIALIRRLEWIVAIALSAVVLFLLIVRATHAGALWRDEAESAQSARMPVGEMFENIQYSSFPILFPVVVRAYTTVFGTSDISLRCFGLATGILLLAVAWLLSRRLSGGVPLLMLAMIGLNVNFLVAGTGLRGYGLGSFLVILAFVFTVRLLLNPSALSLVAVFLAYLASLQCLFLSVSLVAAIIIAALGVLLIRRELKLIWLLMCIALVCALSYISYLLQFYFSGRSWAKVIQVPVSFGLIWPHFVSAWGEISREVSMIWLGLILLSLVGAVCRLAPIWSNHRGPERDFLLFGILLIPLSMIASYAFVEVLPRPPDERYFLALTVLVAATADLIWANFPPWLRVVRIVPVIFATMTLPFAMWGYIVQAESNAETIAKIVEQNAAPRDLIVVNPWSFGVSFNWYYHGAARWMTVPAIEDHRIHRYDLVLAKMEAASPLADVEAEIENVLESGGRVWFAGQLEVPVPGESPAQVGPAPDPNIGWSGSAYRKAWSQQISLFLVRHVQKGNPVDTRSWATISAREIFSLYELEGWKY